MERKIPEHDIPVIIWTDHSETPITAKCWHINDNLGVWYDWVTCDSLWEDYLNDPFSYSINSIFGNVVNWSYIPDKQFDY
jgi:hypothetical protein